MESLNFLARNVKKMPKKEVTKPRASGDDPVKKASTMASNPSSVLESITESWLKAAKEGDLSTLANLRSSGMDINQTNKFGEMAVHYSAALGQMDVLEWLYAHGASFRHGNDMGATPLHMAVSHSQEDVVVFMLERGVDPNLRTRRGASALHIASATSSLSLVKLLVAAGADPRAKTVDGQTPMDYAVKGGNNEIILFLESSALGGIHTSEGKEQNKAQSSSGVSTHGKDRLEAIQKQRKNGSIGDGEGIARTSVMSGDGNGDPSANGSETSRSMATSVTDLPKEEMIATTSNTIDRPSLTINTRNLENGDSQADSTTTTSPPPKLSPQLIADALKAAKQTNGSNPNSSERPTTDLPPLESTEPRRNPLVDETSDLFEGSSVISQGLEINEPVYNKGNRKGKMYSGFAPLAEAPVLEDYIYKFIPNKSGNKMAFSDPRCWRKVIVRLIQNYLLVFKTERDMKPWIVICIEDSFIRDSSLEIGVMHTFAITHYMTNNIGPFGMGMGQGILDEHFFQTRGSTDIDSWVKFLLQSKRSHVKSLIATSHEADMSTRDELNNARQALSSIQQQNEMCLQEILLRETPIAEEKLAVEKMRGHLGASAKARNAIGIVPWNDVSTASTNVEKAFTKVDQKRKMLLVAAGGGARQQSRTAQNQYAQNPVVTGAVDAFAKAGRARRGTFAPQGLKHLAEQVTEAEKEVDNFNLAMERQNIYARKQQEIFKKESKPYKVYYGSADDANNLVGEMDIHQNETVLGLRRQLARELRLKRDSFALQFGNTATLGPGEHPEVQAISVDQFGPIVILPL